MAVTAAVSVASFTVVLAETLTAVAAATLAPAAFLGVARAVKAAAAGNAVTDAGGDPVDGTLSDGLVGEMPGVAQAVDALKKAALAIDQVDLLIPKTANVHAEFTFQADETTSGEAGVGGFVKMVSINAGYSTLYSTSSSNKVTLDIEYGVVNYTL
jgi:hypothetical protein